MLRLYFRTLSPLHIGTGKVLEPFDYVFHQEKVIILDQEACLERMFEKHPDSVDGFVEWIQQTTQRIAGAENEAREARRNRDRKRAQHHYQILSEVRKNFNLIYFCEQILNDRELAGLFLSDSRFHKNAMYALDRPGGTRQLREMLHINGHPYVPGSSLKGAFRTALAYRVLKGLSGELLHHLLNGNPGTNIDGILKPLQKIRALSQKAITAIEKGNEPEINQTLKALQNERRFRIQKRKIGDEVEKVVFGCGDGNRQKEEKYDDPKFDLLRLIKISDSLDGQWELLAGHLMSFTRNNRTGQLNAQPIQYCQFIDEGSVFSVSLEVDTQLIAAILSNRVKGWTGFEEKFNTLFSVDPHLPAEQLEQAVVESILEAIQEFGQAIVEKERAWLQQFGRDEVSQLYEFYENLPGEIALLRVGFSSGWHSTTIGLALAENPALSEYFPEIIYAFNLDLIQNQEKLLKRAERNRSRVEQQLHLLKRTPRPQGFPRSRRLIAENRRPYAPVGWLQVAQAPFQQTESRSKASEQGEDEASRAPNGNEAFEDKLEQLKKKFGE
ncbi:MAG: hypothetical protein Kow0042_20770 [Calditrichia bacterium]